MLRVSAFALLSSSAAPSDVAACFNGMPSSREQLLHSLIVGMFAEPGTVPPGSIIDAGANTGEESCVLASVGDGRVVHAVEPLQVNVEHMKARYAAL